MGLFPCQPQSCEIVLGFVADSSQATGLKWQAPSGSSPTSASATVATSQTTTSATYTDLTTAGPAVTLTTGTKALVIVSSAYSTDVGDTIFTSFAVSGATTIAATDNYGLGDIAQTGQRPLAASRATRLSSLTAGSNTFTLKYRTANGATGAFKNREIIVIDLGS